MYEPCCDEGGLMAAKKLLALPVFAVTLGRTLYVKDTMYAPPSPRWCLNLYVGSINFRDKIMTTFV